MAALLEIGKVGVCIAHKERNGSHTVTPAMGGVITCSCCLPSTLQAMPFVCRKELLEKLGSVITLIFPFLCILYFLVWASPSCLPSFFFLVAAAVIAESRRLSVANSKNTFKAAPGIDKYPTWHVYMLSSSSDFLLFVLLLLEQSFTLGSLHLQSNTPSFSSSCPETMGSPVSTSGIKHFWRKKPPANRKKI